MVLPRIVSDHNPVLLILNDQLVVGPFPFWFEIMLNSHAEFRNKIFDWWNIHVHGSPMFRVFHKLKHIKIMIKGWNKWVFGDVFHHKREITKKLKVNQKRIEEGDVNVQTCK